MIVTLTDTEYRLAKALAKAKNDYAESQGFKSVKRDRKRSQIELKMQGFAAELAVCRTLNVYPDLSEKYSMTDIKYKDKTINVKSTHYKTGKLLVPDYQGKTADIYILVIASHPDYEIKGWCTCEELFKTKNIDNIHNLGKSWVLGQEELRPWRF